MPSFSSLNTAITGLRAAQTGLAVTGHNMANAEISGFSRQRSIQTTTPSRTLGNSLAGNPLRVGTGVDNQAVHHIRSRYFDHLYRQHNARLHFYSVMTSVGEHIENILGETENSFRLQHILSDLWNSMHELNMNQGAIETRDVFIASVISFLDKAHNIFDELFELQRNLDAQVRAMVDEINQVVAGIHQLNQDIERNEMAGDNANDLRDERHRLMDRLSGLVPVQFHEDFRTGRIDITTINGNWFLSQGAVNPLGLKQISGQYSLVEPVFTHYNGVLSSDTPPARYVPLFSWTVPINAAHGNDHGALMALLRARGSMPLTYRGVEGLWNPANPTTRPDMLPNTGPNGSPGWFPIPDPTDANFWADWLDYLDDWMPFLSNNNYNGPLPPGFPLIDPNDSDTWPEGWLTLPDADFTGVPPFPSGVPIILSNDPGTWPEAWGGYWLGDDVTYAAGPPPDAFHLFYEDPAFVGAVRRYTMERHNDLLQFHSLFPQSFSNPTGFNTAVAALNSGPPITNQLALAIRDQYRAARRTYNQVEWSQHNALIPRVMMQMDQVVNSVVRLINNSLSPIGEDQEGCPDAPFDLNRQQSRTEVIIRMQHTRFGPDGIHNPGQAGNTQSLYTTRNLMLNPALLGQGGFNLLGLHDDGDLEDTRVIEEMIRQWGLSNGDFSITINGHSFSILDAYGHFIVNLAIEVNEAGTLLGSQFTQVTQADHRRTAISGVATDEELTSMMAFQFAYQAAARLFNIIDGMIDTVINRTGRVGL